jgi:hypothetical protein
MKRLRRILWIYFFWRICFVWAGGHVAYAQQTFERDNAIFKYVTATKSLKLQVSNDTLPPAAGYVKLVVKDTNSVYLVFPTGYKVNVKVSGGGGSSVITSITAGNGLSGGGSSGTVTLRADTTVIATLYDLSLKSNSSDTAGGDLSGTLANLQFRTGAVTSTDILDGTIASGDLASSSVPSVKIVDGTIISQDISTGGVASINVLDGTIDSVDIGTGKITSTKLKDSTVNTIDLAPLAITTSRIAANAVDSSKLASNSVYTGKVADGTLLSADASSEQFVKAINGAKDSVVFTGSGGLSITTKLHTYPTPDTLDFNAGAGGGGGSITSIASGNSRMTVTNPTGASTTLTIPNAGIDSAALANFQIGANKIAPSAITSEAIADATITSVDLSAGAVDGPALGIGAVQNENLGDEVVFSNNIYPGAVGRIALEPGSKAYDSDSTDYARKLSIILSGYMRGDTLRIANASITTASVFSAPTFRTSKPVNGTPYIDSVWTGGLRIVSTFANEPDSAYIVFARISY